MAYPMTDEDRAIQDKARRFVDEELIPLEVEAEMHGGEIPEEVEARQKKLLKELGLSSINMPKELGGDGLTMFQQVLVSEQIGRVTNALGWVLSTGPLWAVEVFDDEQIERYLKPIARGDMHECYAITEPRAGSDVDAIEATARRDGAEYVLNGRKWHVTSFNKAQVVFFQGRLVGGEHYGEHAMFIVDNPTPGLVLVEDPAYSHTYAHHHATLDFEDVRVPVENLVGA